MVGLAYFFNFEISFPSKVGMIYSIN